MGMDERIYCRKGGCKKGGKIKPAISAKKSENKGESPCREGKNMVFL